MKHDFKLSKRIQKIESMVTSHYDHIWDCCCDHGLLGMSLLSQQENSKVHFVDIVPELMATLKNKLERFYKNFTWQSHCIDVAKLPLAQYQGKHLVIIAGVGGDLMIKFIEAIYQQHKRLNIDFLLCPVHHQYALRQKLIKLDFSLKNEVLIEDNRRFYEILHVSSTSNITANISPIGDNIWCATDDYQAAVVDKYLTKTLSHYQRIQQGKNNNVQNIIDAYRAIKP